MSLEIAYAAMGGDLETVRGRLLTDERIEKFAKIFLQDTSMQMLEGGSGDGRLLRGLPRGPHLEGRESRFGVHAAVRGCERPV